MTDTGSMIVAVPSEGDGGLDAPRSGHFGQSPHFTLVNVADGVVGGATVVANGAHAQGGCGATVVLLSQHNVTHVVAAGMGRGPLNGLLNAGIDVYHDGEAPTVRGAVESMLSGTADRFGGDHVCSGHSH